MGYQKQLSSCLILGMKLKVWQKLILVCVLCAGFAVLVALSITLLKNN